MDETTPRALGLSEQELREILSEELSLAIRAEQNTPTIHAIAHAVARTISLDHLRIAEQLQREGIEPAGVAPGSHARGSH